MGRLLVSRLSLIKSALIETSLNYSTFSLFQSFLMCVLFSRVRVRVRVRLFDPAPSLEGLKCVCLFTFLFLYC